ncbi:hypothetical protein [Streptomyces sp. NPDC058157]|uniref:hypothetical protein n=1 Tax=Streptomyces sp. NPDC058157 TaxID=3346360 RepID=UPI0036F0B85B
MSKKKNRTNQHRKPTGMKKPWPQPAAAKNPGVVFKTASDEAAYLALTLLPLWADVDSNRFEALKATCDVHNKLCINHGINGGKALLDAFGRLAGDMFHLLAHHLGMTKEALLDRFMLVVREDEIEE